MGTILCLQQTDQFLLEESQSFVQCQQEAQRLLLWTRRQCRLDPQTDVPEGIEYVQ